MKNALMIFFCFFSLLLTAQNSQQRASNPQINFPGFSKLTQKVYELRESRLVSLDDFKKMASVAGTIILDTRSKENFENRHIKGAIHLNFSEFTEEKLASIIPSKTTRILIYCNNNFKGDIRAFALKSAPLALNIPTFINLHGYGYENVYELRDVVELPTKELELEGRWEE